MTEQTPNPENTEMEEEENGSSGKGGLVFALVLFIILFVASMGLHLYQQIQLGDGSVAWEIAGSQERVAQQKADELEEENESLKEQIETLELDLEEARAELDDPAHSRENPDWMTGTHYEVQIGAFKFFDMQWYEDNFEQMRMERDGDYSHITLGRFTDLDRARTFREDIQRLGIESTMIVERTDGNRVGMVE